MKRKVLISMYSLNIGGAERSLIGLLESFDYRKYEVDLFLYRHEGEFLILLPKGVNLLPEIIEYTTLERPIKNILTEGYVHFACLRILAKLKTRIKSLGQRGVSTTYKQMQYTWDFTIPWLPKFKKKYDVAISFLGPHHFILEKVTAKVKFGWNHTDYFTIVNPDKKLDEKMWSKLDYIVNVSQDAQESFLKVFPDLKHKTVVIENIISSSFVLEQSKEAINREMPDDGSIKICSIGRFSDAKGFDLAIVACKKLVALGLNIKWYIIGYGAQEDYLKNLIKEHKLKDRFILLGKKVNPYPFIKNCDIYCQPSRYEGKAVTVREAQILGKPVVITDFPTAKSQLQDGEDGIITPLSIEGIVNGIKVLIENKQLKDKLIQNTLVNDYSNRLEIEKIYSLMQGNKQSG